MTWDYYEYRIAEHYIFAIEYGDYGEMSDQEISQFQAWLEYEQAGIAGNWSIEEHGMEDYGHCAVSGLFVNSVQVRFNFKRI